MMNTNHAVWAAASAGSDLRALPIPSMVELVQPPVDEHYTCRVYRRWGRLQSLDEKKFSRRELTVYYTPSVLDDRWTQPNHTPWLLRSIDAQMCCCPDRLWIFKLNTSRYLNPLTQPTYCLSKPIFNALNIRWCFLSLKRALMSRGS